MRRVAAVHEPAVAENRQHRHGAALAWDAGRSLLEERDLVADFGDVYRRYQRQVPMLVPWRGPAR